MSLGIVGVCIGDVNFTSRNYNTNLGNPSQRTRDKQKNFQFRGPSNVKAGQDACPKTHRSDHKLSEKELNASKLSPDWKPNKIKNENEISTDIKNGTRYIYVGGSDIKGSI